MPTKVIVMIIVLLHYFQFNAPGAVVNSHLVWPSSVGINNINFVVF